MNFKDARAHWPFLIAFLISGCTAGSKDRALDEGALSKEAESKWTCDSFKASLPKDYQTGFISSPLNEDLRSLSLKIFYYGKWKGDSPILLINGGPGGSSWGFHQTLVSELQARQIDFLFFDQRGTGCSSPPPAATVENFAQFKDFGSRGIATDIENLRQSLKLNSRLRLFGHSYGVKVGLRYLSLFPQHLKGLLIYGDYEVPDNEGAIREIKEINRAPIALIKKRTQENPAFAAALKTLHQRLTPELCVSAPGGFSQVCGFDLVQMVGASYHENTFNDIERKLIQLSQQSEIKISDFERLIEDGSWWQISPRILALTHLEYRESIKGRDVCDWASEDTTEPWQLSPCWFGKIRGNFDDRYPLPMDFLEPKQVESAAALTPGHITEFTSALDEENFVTVDHSAYKNWEQHDLPGSTHGSFSTYPRFWQALQAL